MSGISRLFAAAATHRRVNERKEEPWPDKGLPETCWRLQRASSYRAWANYCRGGLGMAVLMFALAFVLWFFWMGWVIHLWAILDAAMWKPKQVV